MIFHILEVQHGGPKKEMKLIFFEDRSKDSAEQDTSLIRDLKLPIKERVTHAVQKTLTLCFTQSFRVLLSFLQACLQRAQVYQGLCPSFGHEKSARSYPHAKRTAAIQYRYETLSYLSSIRQPNDGLPHYILGGGSRS